MGQRDWLEQQTARRDEKGSTESASRKLPEQEVKKKQAKDRRGKGSNHSLTFVTRSYCIRLTEHVIRNESRISSCRMLLQAWPMTWRCTQTVFTTFIQSHNSTRIFMQIQQAQLNHQENHNTFLKVFVLWRQLAHFIPIYYYIVFQPIKEVECVKMSGNAKHQQRDETADTSQCYTSLRVQSRISSTCFRHPWK